MHKVVGGYSPSSIQDLFTFHYPDSKDSKHSNFNIPVARLKPHKNSIFIKGTHFYNQLVPQISCSLDPGYDPTKSMQPKPFKNCMKVYLQKQQAQGDADEWSIDNLSMYTGSRRSERIAERNIQ